MTVLGLYSDPSLAFGNYIRTYGAAKRETMVYFTIMVKVIYTFM